MKKPDPSDPVLQERLALLKQAETWSRDQHDAYQLGELKKVLAHAGAHVPYYRRLFAETRFDPKSVASLADLEALPLLDKETVRAHHADFIAETCDPADLIEMTTGGSTGDPLRVPWDKRFHSLNTANTYYYMSVAGYVPGDHASVRLHGDTIDDALIEQGRYWAVDGKQLTLSVHHISDETCAAYVSRINEHRPEYIHAYPSALFMLCEYMEKTGLTLEEPVAAAFCDSETLFGWQKRRIGKTLGCRIYGVYGHTEGAVCAITFPNSEKFHLLPQVGITEILDSGGKRLGKDGESGEIVVTGFNSDVFPLVRYRTGDIGTIATPEGLGRRHHMLLSDVEGRIQDFVVNRAGNLVAIAPALFDYQFDWSGIDRFQIHQETEGVLVFRIVPADRERQGSNVLADRVVSGFQQILNNQFKITVELADDIPLTARGKFRYVDQHLPVNV